MVEKRTIFFLVDRLVPALAVAAMASASLRLNLVGEAGYFGRVDSAASSSIHCAPSVGLFSLVFRDVTVFWALTQSVLKPDATGRLLSNKRSSKDHKRFESALLPTGSDFVFYVSFVFCDMGSQLRRILLVLAFLDVTVSIRTQILFRLTLEERVFNRSVTSVSSLADDLLSSSDPLSPDSSSEPATSPSGSGPLFSSSSVVASRSDNRRMRCSSSSIRAKDSLASISVNLSFATAASAARLSSSSAFAFFVALASAALAALARFPTGSSFRPRCFGNGERGAGLPFLLVYTIYQTT